MVERTGTEREAIKTTLKHRDREFLIHSMIRKQPEWVEREREVVGG